VVAGIAKVKLRAIRTSLLLLVLVEQMVKLLDHLRKDCHPGQVVQEKLARIHYS
jgi:hypothetical protein